jgi:iron-sulfur cluster assembly protein
LVTDFIAGLTVPVDEENEMGMPLRRLQVVTLTDAAAERVRDIVARSEKPVIGVRVGVRNGGCAGMAYTVDVAEAARPGEDVVEDKGATVLVDPKAVLFLLGTRMDYRSDKFASQFVFENPNQTSACGCGESVAIEPAKPEALTAGASANRRFGSRWTQPRSLSFFTRSDPCG